MKNRCLILTIAFNITLMMNAQREVDFSEFIEGYYCEMTSGKSQIFIIPYSDKRMSETIVKLNGVDYYSFRLDSCPDYGYYPIDTLYYRQKDEKVFRYDKKSGTDILMFDFSLKPGNVFVDYQGRELTVTSVGDTVVYLFYDKQITLRQIKLKDRNDSRYQDTWIEGLGSARTGLLIPSDIEEVKSISLLYHCGFMEEHVCCLKNEPGIKSVVKRCQRTEERFVPNELQYEFTDGSLHITGYLDLGVRMRHYFFLLIDNNKIDLRCHSLAPFVDGIASHVIDLTFPEVTPGNYEFYYNGKPCDFIKGEATSVSTLLNFGDKDLEPRSAELRAEALFDLSGRRITGKPGRGVYIQGKRKVMVNN